MKCLNRGMIQEYIDQELCESTAKEVEQHLKECKDCNLRVEEIRGGIVNFRKVYEEALPENLPRINLDLNRKQQKPERERYSGIRIPIPVFSMILILFVFMSVALFFQGKKIQELDDPVIKNIRDSITLVERTDDQGTEIILSDLNLDGYEAVEKLDVKVIKGENNELKDIE